MSEKNTGYNDSEDIKRDSGECEQIPELCASDDNEGPQGYVARCHCGEIAYWVLENGGHQDCEVTSRGSRSNECYNIPPGNTVPRKDFCSQTTTAEDRTVYRRNRNECSGADEMCGNQEALAQSDLEYIEDNPVTSEPMNTMMETCSSGRCKYCRKLLTPDDLENSAGDRRQSATQVDLTHARFTSSEGGGMDRNPTHWNWNNSNMNATGALHQRQEPARKDACVQVPVDGSGIFSAHQNSCNEYFRKTPIPSDLEYQKCHGMPYARGLHLMQQQKYLCRHYRELPNNSLSERHAGSPYPNCQRYPSQYSNRLQSEYCHQYVPESFEDMFQNMNIIRHPYQSRPNPESYLEQFPDNGSTVPYNSSCNKLMFYSQRCSCSRCNEPWDARRNACDLQCSAQSSMPLQNQNRSSKYYPEYSEVTDYHPSSEMGSYAPSHYNNWSETMTTPVFNENETSSKYCVNYKKETLGNTPSHDFKIQPTVLTQCPTGRELNVSPEKPDPTPPSGREEDTKTSNIKENSTKDQTKTTKTSNIKENSTKDQTNPPATRSRKLPLRIYKNILVKDQIYQNADRMLEELQTVLKEKGKWHGD